MSLCKYANALGKPGKGVHSWRVGNVAVADLLLTVLAAYLTHRLFPKQLSLPCSLLAWFVSGFALHWLFCVNTTWTLALFRPDGKPFPTPPSAPPHT